MKSLFLILSIIFSVNSFAGISAINPVVPTVTMGGVTLPLNQAKIMKSICGIGLYDSFRYNGAIYQVPTGKKLVIVAIASTSTLGAGNGYGEVGSATASVSNSSIPTGYTSLTAYGGGSSTMNQQSTNSPQATAFYGEVASSKYPIAHCAGSDWVTIMGYEQ